LVSGGLAKKRQAADPTDGRADLIFTRDRVSEKNLWNVTWPPPLTRSIEKTDARLDVERSAGELLKQAA
jgi:hypothetical protein